MNPTNEGAKRLYIHWLYNSSFLIKKTSPSFLLPSFFVEIRKFKWCDPKTPTQLQLNNFKFDDNHQPAAT